MFSYVDLESRIPKDHPIRKIREIVDTALQEIEPWFDDMYAAVGRLSLADSNFKQPLATETIRDNGSSTCSY